ncbi:MAG: ribose 5-phosphate isomerase A, partial [Anaerolineae bacterium]
MTDAQARLKQQAAANAVELVSGGMVIGLGTGSTTNFAIDMLGQKVQSGQLTGITGVPTSEATAGRAKAVGIPLGELADFSALDLAIDGADEVDPALNLTKGWGGALVREKLVESCAERLVIIVDESKMVPRLGTRGPLPVEVVPFAWQVQARSFQGTTASPTG